MMWLMLFPLALGLIFRSRLSERTIKGPSGCGGCLVWEARKLGNGIRLELMERREALSLIGRNGIRELRNVL